MNTQSNSLMRGAHTFSHHVTYILQKLTTELQKCDAEVLSLPGTNSTVQTSQRPEQKLTHTWPIARVTPLIGHLVSRFSLGLTPFLVP